MPVDKYHPPLNLSLNCNQFNILPINNVIHDFKNCNFNNIIKFIVNSIPDILSEKSNVNNLVDNLYSIIYEAINLLVPSNIVNYNSFPTWYSNNLKSLLIQKKKNVHLIYKKYNNVSDYINFFKLRAICKRTTKNDYKNYIHKVQLSVKKNPKYFYRFIKNRKGNNAIPKIMSNGTSQLTVVKK